MRLGFLNSFFSDSRRQTLIAVVILLAVSLFLHLGFLASPNETVFDEVHFGKFVSAYFTGAYYFDIHPPLGKLLIALGAFWGGYSHYVQEQGIFDFENISEAYGGVPYIWFRLFPALAGAFIPLAAFLFMRSLRLSKRASLLVMFCLVFDNALLAHTRLVLLDAFLLLFGFLGLFFFFDARNKNYPWRLLLLSGLLFGLSLSVKWTGLAFLGLAGLIALFDFIRRNPERQSRLHFAAKIFISLVVVPFVVYFLVFLIHFALLPRDGFGNAYMSPAFQNGELSLWGKFLELNQKMGFYNATLKSPHSYGSPAWSWPIMLRPVYYWFKQTAPGIAGRIYLLGNPIIWWLASLGVITFIVFIRKLTKISGLTKAVLLVGYGANFLPFFSVSRVLFLYHYFAAFIFSLIMLGVVLEGLAARFSPSQACLFWSVLMALIFLCFVFFLPLTLGLPISEAMYKLHLWLSSWI